jgi:hypothetical protein
MSMTWHLGARASETIRGGISRRQLDVYAGLLAALIAMGCGSSGSKNPQITLLAPEDMAELTIADDQDPDIAGVQFEVRAQTRNIAAKTVMLLIIPGENMSAYLTEVDEEGLAIFEKATLPPGAHQFHINTAIGSVSSDEYSYTLKTLVIQSPRDGADVAFGDDTDLNRDGLQIDVTVKAYAVDPSEDISLSVDGKKVADAESPDSSGVAVFENVTLETGNHTLKAVAGNVESGDTKISVNEACASVTFVTPEVAADAERLTLGGGNSCPKSGDDFTADFVISTDAGEGRDVELTVNNTTKQKTKVSGALAKFEGVVLNRRMSANDVTVTVQGAGGVTCAPVPFPKGIYVDCDGSDCSIGSPVPYSGEKAGGDPAFYLNKSMLNGDGFDIRVDSDSGVVGKQLELIVDGRDGRNALMSQAVPNGNRLSATFSKVKLSQGEHKIEARCTDTSGNVTESGELTWVVDTDACSVDIDEPASNALFLPSNDSDSNDGNGIMVPLKVNVGGSDCIESRRGICVPSAGITGTDFEDLSGSSINGEVTLTSGKDQQVCVEVRDRANNIGLGNVGVRYRSATPTVEIESPGNDTKFNATGSGGNTADSKSSTPACDADFRVLCTEVGGTVQLHRTDENGPVIATGTCEAGANGDPAIPSGFSGRAKLDDVSFLTPGADNTSVVATQTVAGDSNQNLIGKSDPISLTGWCEIPLVSLLPSCPPEYIQLPGSNMPATVDILALYNGPVKSHAPDEAIVTVTAGGTEISTDTQPRPTNPDAYSYTFDDVSLGNAEQTVETKIIATDDYANTKTITCTTTVVQDLPTLTISAPSANDQFGPTDGCTLNPAVPDKFGVPVSLVLDTTTNRTLGYKINNMGNLVSIPITGTNMNVCLPVGDGASTLNFELRSTMGNGLAKPSVAIDIDMIEITAPLDGAALSQGSDACDPGFGANVTASVAPVFNTVGATVSAGSTTATGTVNGGTFTACVELQTGTNMITVSIDGKSVSRSIEVTVVGSTPTHSISLNNVILPSGNSYRTMPVSLGWDAPDQDYNGQLKTYQLRCSAATIAGSETDQNKEAWWASANVVSIGSVTPPLGTSASVPGIRVGEKTNCVLRGLDAGNQPTPIPDSFPVDFAFREVKVDTGDLNSMGYAIAAVGDVNDDNVNDVLVGGRGKAYLYFGSSGGVTNKTSPDVTFSFPGGQQEFEFGTRVAALGDVNGDGENDFAISHPSWDVSSTVGAAGAVFFFYGRKSDDAWPTTEIDLTPADQEPPCKADACFFGEQSFELLGTGISAAGDFDNDNRPDIAIGAPGRDGFVGRQYVLLGRAFQGAGARPGDFWQVVVQLPNGDPYGFYVDGRGDTGSDATSSFQMGNSIAPLGNINGAVGADLLLGAVGSSGVATSKLALLAGRTHDGSLPHLKSIDPATLVIKDSGTDNEFAVRLVPLRNWYNAGAQSGVVDVGVFNATGDQFSVYLGDANGGAQSFDPTTKILVAGRNGTGFGNAGLGVGSTFNPSLGPGSLSDLDADGLDDMCVASANGVGGSGVSPLYVFYGSDAVTKVVGNSIGDGKATQVAPSARPGATNRTIQAVGDITGDGQIDLIMGEPTAGSNNGGFTVLY